MRVVLFVGPSINADDCQCVFTDAIVLPPATAGDLYRASRYADVIGLCDGYFDHHLSVWHKEVLWALSKGIRVYGAASIGALRAAELEMFGMVGVGRIFEQFRDGMLEDDDEVAVVHEPAEKGYRPRSDALVNMRATLELATREGVLSSASAERLVDLAKRTHYAVRSYARLFEDAQAASVSPAELSALGRFLRSRLPVNQKRLDAMAMLQRILADTELTERAPLANFRFENTSAWVALKARIDREVRAGDLAERPNVERSVAPTLSPTPAAAQSGPRDLYTDAVERALALQFAERQEGGPSAAAVQARSEQFRRTLNLQSPEDTHDWLAGAGLDIESFSAFIYDQLRVEQFLPEARAAALEQLGHAKLVRLESPAVDTREGDA